MYKGLSRGVQSRSDRGSSSKNGRPKSVKKGRPKGKIHVQLEAVAANSEMAGWLKYIDNCRQNGTTPFVPAAIRRKLDLDD